MAEKIFDAQSNYGWGLSLNMTGKAPAVAKRIFDKYSDALAYVNDFNDSAIEGLQLSVVADTDSKKNGVYFVEKIGTFVEADGVKTAKNDGVLVKVGGTETETATNYSAAVTLSNNLAIGQLIKVSNEETVGNQKYKAGFYIVNGPGSISALDTSTGSTDEIGALTNRVTELESSRVKNTDFETYKAGVVTALEGKAAAADFAAHATKGVDSAENALHVTLADKTAWNNAETNAKQFASNEIAKLSNVYDAKGAAGTAESNAKTYTDEEIVKVKAYADQAEADANSYADGLNSAMDTRVKSLEDHKDDYKAYADQAELDAIASAKEYSDGLDTAMNTRVEALEAIGHTHANKAELDKIVDGDKAKWDAAVGRLETFLDSEQIEGTVDTLHEIQNWMNGDGVNATELTEAIAAEAKLRGDADSAMATRIKDLEDHKEDYKAYADQAEADANSYADGLNGAMDTRVKANEDAIAIITSTDDTKEGSIAKAKADAIAAAQAKIEALKLADTYETKADAETKLSEAKSYADGLNSAMDTRVKSLEDHKDDYKAYADGLNSAMDTRVKDLEDHKEDYKAYADQAEADAIAEANAYSTAYTDTLFESIKFVANSDIDSIFA